jgi:hypothetical protein
VAGEHVFVSSAHADIDYARAEKTPAAPPSRTVSREDPAWAGTTTPGRAGQARNPEDPRLGGLADVGNLMSVHKELSRPLVKIMSTGRLPVA